MGRSYRCPPGCVSRAAGRLDEYVAAVITARLARPDAADLLTPPATEPDLRICAGGRSRCGRCSTNKPGCMPAA